MRSGSRTRSFLLGLIVFLALVLIPLGVAAGSRSTSGAGPASVTSHSRAVSVSGRCSKAEGTAVVKRLGLSDPAVAYPVYKVLCGAFTGPGSQIMIASIYGPDNTGMTDWAVFRMGGGEWQLLMKRHQPALVTAAGSDIREAVPIYLANDQFCCPSGGTKVRTWHWNGQQFVADAWTGGAKGKGFYSPIEPSRNLACDMGDFGQFPAVRCQTGTPPLSVSMDAGGRLEICRGRRCVSCICDEGRLPILGYGRQVTLGRFRCVSLETGMRCTVMRSGKGFLINRAGVSRVGQ